MAKTDKRSSQDDVAKIAWRAWTIRFVPLFIMALIALIQFGYFNAFPVVFVLLAIVLLHQRFIKARSWESILWGGLGSSK